MKTQWFEIEVASTTYRTYQVKAESPDKANEIALAEMDADWEISKAWKQNAEVVSCDPFSYDEDITGRPAQRGFCRPGKGRPARE